MNDRLPRFGFGKLSGGSKLTSVGAEANGEKLNLDMRSTKEEKMLGNADVHEGTP